MKTESRLRLLLAAVLLGACATHTMTPPPEPPPEPGLYGVAGGRLVKVGDPRELAAAAELDGVAAMTYDPTARRFYAVANGSGQPQLIAVRPSTGEVTAVTPIESPDLELTLVEGLAFHPPSGTLYATGGSSTFASNVLLAVDPATGEARQIGRIRGTIQEEVDAMAFAGAGLVAVDSAGNSSALYRLDPDLGHATRLAAPFPRSVADLAFDPTNGRLYGVDGDGGRLLAISLDGQRIEEMPAGAEPMSALAVVPGGDASLFADGFESGDASAWPRRTEQQP